MRGGDDDPVFVRYRADIWVEVASGGDIVGAVVDSTTMEEPLDVVGPDGSAVVGGRRAVAVEAAQTGEWPTWDFGSRPVAAEIEHEDR